jgi:3-hydroxybutyryl-CoA dehydrogenase
MQHVASGSRGDKAPPEPLPESLAELVRQDARGISNGHGFYEYTPEEAARWEERQRRHAWLIKEWLDAEFPIESPATPPD